jgi:TRAP-type C4-dicarboxylate transport system permease small subunit
MLRTGLRSLSVAVGWLGWVIDIATCTMLAAIVVIWGAEVVARNLFNYSLVWVQESAVLLASWIYFLGICLVYQHKGDITVDFFKSVLGIRLQHAWAVACHVVSGVVFAVVAVQAWELVKLQAPFRTSGMGLPNALFSMPVMIGSIVLVLITARDAIAALVGEDDPAPPADSPI